MLPKLIAAAVLGHWAFNVPGFHDGPLGGRVLDLPATVFGRPRFLIDAITHAGMGLDVPAQVSVWEWTGGEAALELIADYRTTYDVHAVRRDGDLLRIATKEETKIISSCGMCDEPRGTWSLRLTAVGVSDLGHVFEEPLLGLADELLLRVALGEDASSLAAPEVIAQLDELCQPDPGTATGQDGDRKLALMGMLGNWQVTGTRARRVLDLETDAFHLVFTIVKRGGADYVITMRSLAEPAAP